MPFYDFRCDCGNEFNIMARMSDLDDKSIECPDCGSNNLQRIYGNINVLHSTTHKEFECPNAHICGANCHH